MDSDNAQSALVVTSSIPSEGKSSIASKLALSLAVGGQPVILLDCDLRRPVQAKAFGLTHAVGIADLILRTTLPSTSRSPSAIVPICPSWRRGAPRLTLRGSLGPRSSES